jgi:hypothetical protein
MRPIARRAATSIMSLGDRIGIHVAPANDYSPSPSRRWLRANEALWRHASPLPGVHWDLRSQIDWLSELVTDQAAELTPAALRAGVEELGGAMPDLIDAQVLHAFVRSAAPGRIVELGGGASTLVMSMAAARNREEGRSPTTIDVFGPHLEVSHLPDVTSHARDIRTLVADDLQLVAGDLLVVGTSHVVRTGSEVPHIYVNVLPALTSGVIVQISDIFLPYLFQPDLYDQMYDWQETTLVAALLSNSKSLSILASLSGLADQGPDVLRPLFPDHVGQSRRDGLATGSPRGSRPGSLWVSVR